nr:formate dehydrogenase [Quercus suber]
MRLFMPRGLLTGNDIDDGLALDLDLQADGPDWDTRSFNVATKTNLDLQFLYRDDLRFGREESGHRLRKSNKHHCIISNAIIATDHENNVSGILHWHRLTAQLEKARSPKLPELQHFIYSSPAQRATPSFAQRGAAFARSTGGVRTLTASAPRQGKVLLVLYDGGEHAAQEPKLLGTTENELGIRKWIEDQGHTLVTTSDKEGENSKFDQELVDAEVIITTPFHPGYLTAERLAKAKKLKLAVTAGIGSDHVDLNAANTTNGGITVAEVTGSNVVSVAEHVIMTMLVLVRNFVPAHDQVASGKWDVAAVAKNEYDLEGKTVGTVAVGRIGERVLRRLKPFDCKELLYFDYQPLAPEVEKEIGCRRVDSLEEMLGQCDVVTINCPLHEKTRGLFNKELISKMKKGSWLVNTARGAIVVKEDVADALKSGQLRGYGGDVWFPQPAPADHPLRTASYSTWGGGNAMTPHMSGTSLDAQARYAAGTKAILDEYFSGRENYRPQDLIVYKGDYATKAYGQRPKK